MRVLRAFVLRVSFCCVSWCWLSFFGCVFFVLCPMICVCSLFCFGYCVLCQCYVFVCGVFHGVV